MPDPASVRSQTSSPEPPPCGDPQKADHYIAKLVELLGKDILTVSHTDLAQFDPTSLQDHYRLQLKDYEAEVSHNKQADTGKDFYIILFNNLKSVSEGCCEKVILAYMRLSEEQFKRFKSAAHEQVERKRKEAEEKRFKEAMIPIDEALNQLTDSKPATFSVSA